MSDESQTYRSEYEQAFQRGREHSAYRIEELERELAEAKENEIQQVLRSAKVTNDLREQLSAERALADRLGNWMQEHRKAWQWQNVDPDCDCEDCVFLRPFDEALAAWKEARHE